jgi:hypothetical protein
MDTLGYCTTKNHNGHSIDRKWNGVFQCRDGRVLDGRDDIENHSTVSLVWLGLDGAKRQSQEVGSVGSGCSARRTWIFIFIIVVKSNDFRKFLKSITCNVEKGN